MLPLHDPINKMTGSGSMVMLQNPESEHTPPHRNPNCCLAKKNCDQQPDLMNQLDSTLFQLRYVT